MAKLRRARVRGRPAALWLIRGTCLELRRGHDEAAVPVGHLADEDLLAGHVARLQDKRWVPRAAIEELLDLAAGVRRDA